MWKIAVAATIVTCFARPAYAETLSNVRIAGNEVLAGAASSCWVTLRIKSVETPLRVAGWQLVCRVAPLDDSASGIVSVSGFATPDQYFLDGYSWGIGWMPDPTIGDIFWDSALPEHLPSGVEVSTSETDLLRIELTSYGACGRFGVFIEPGDGTEMSSNWMSPGSLPVANDFDLATIPGALQGAVASAQFGSVPEPSGILMLLSMVVAGFVLAPATCRFLRGLDTSSADRTRAKRCAQREAVG